MEIKYRKKIFKGRLSTLFRLLDELYLAHILSLLMMMVNKDDIPKNIISLIVCCNHWSI